MTYTREQALKHFAALVGLNDEKLNNLDVGEELSTVEEFTLASAKDIDGYHADGFIKWSHATK